MDEETRKRIAKRAVSSIIQLVTAGLLFKTSQAVSSENLLEEIGSVVKKNGTIAYRLIELGVLLDSPKPVARTKIQRLVELAKNDLITSRMIQMVVLNRLYMFKTSLEDKQWLSGKVGIDMPTQQLIEYKGKKTRRMKQ